MQLPFVSRRAYELLLAERDRLLSELSAAKEKCETQQLAILRCAQTPEAQEFVRRTEPGEQAVDAEPLHPGSSAPWTAILDYFEAKMEWDATHGVKH